MKTVYLFDAITKLFMGSYPCQLNPEEKGENEEDVYIEPECSTPIEPPSFGEDSICSWTGEEWVLSPVPTVEISEEPLDPATAPEKFTAFLNANPDVRALFGL